MRRAAGLTWIKVASGRLCSACRMERKRRVSPSAPAPPAHLARPGPVRPRRHPPRTPTADDSADADLLARAEALLASLGRAIADQEDRMAALETLLLRGRGAPPRIGARAPGGA